METTKETNMKIKGTVIAVSMAICSTSVLAGQGWDGYGRASASQSAYGGNSVRANSLSTGNGSAYNAAGSSTLVGGSTTANVRTMGMYTPETGYVRGKGYSASASDVKQVNTWAVSNNSGNGTGSAFSSGYAYGGGRASGYAMDYDGNYCYGNKAESRVSGAFSNQVNASSYAHDSNPRVNRGVEVSEHNALASAELEISGFAGANSRAALAKDSKEITTFTSTFSDGRGSAFARSSGRAGGSVFERTRSYRSNISG